MKIVVAIGLALLALPGRADACTCPLPSAVIAPADGATAVPLNATPQVIVTGSATFTLTSGAETVALTTNEPVPGRWYTLVPAALAPNTTYTLTVETSANTETSTFTTGTTMDTTAEPFAGLSSLSAETMTYPITDCQSSCITAQNGRISRLAFELAPRPADAAVVVFELDEQTFALTPTAQALMTGRIAPHSCSGFDFQLTPGAQVCGRVTTVDVAGNVSASEELCSPTLACAPRGDCEPSAECVVDESDLSPVGHGGGCAATSPALGMGLAVLALRRRARRTR